MMEHVRIERQITLVYDNIFDGDIDVPAVLKDLPKMPAIEFVTYMLHLFNVRMRDDSDFQSRHLYQWMMQMGGESQARLLKFVTDYNEVIHTRTFKFLDRRSCLNLIQHLLVYANGEEQRALNRQDYSLLFKVLLFFNVQEAKLQEDIFNWNGTGMFEEFLDGILRVQIRNIENARFKDYALQFLKGYYFFQFCETDRRYSLYLKTFVDKLNLPSYKSYLWRVISPYLAMMDAEEPTPKIYISDGNVLSFFQRLSINDHAQIDNDYKQIRSYPLCQLDANHFLFLDFRFFVDKLYNGFLFDFASLTGLSFSRLKQEMGEDFSERILFSSVMKNCFSSYGDVRLNGLELKAKLGSAEPDYYLRQDNEICLFEFKDILLPASVKYADTVVEIKKGILERLERDAKGNRKGITQLLNSIKGLLNGNYQNKGVDTVSNNNLVYPIIVHTDVSLEAYGVNYFLNNRMQQYIEEMGLPSNKIKNLVLIHIETLLQFQDQFKNGKLDLVACLKAYLNYISTGDPVNDTFPFDEFLKYHFVRFTGEQIRQPELFREIVAEFSQSA